MLREEFPILEFDGVTDNIIEPSKFAKKIHMPEEVVMCFYNEVIEKLKDEGKLREITCLYSQMGRHPIYEIEYNGRKVALYQPGIGSSFGAALMEEVIALGGKKFISCGSGGVLDSQITVGHILVPTVAVRDEGTSYHYLEPKREVSVDEKAVNAIKTVLERHKCSYKLIKTWTTDSLYRETKAKAELRKSEGCLAVEMECSAFAAVAIYRNVKFGQMIYAGDDVNCKEWDARDEFDRSFVRESLLWFSVEACLEL